MGKLADDRLEVLFPAIAAGSIPAFSALFALLRKRVLALALAFTNCQQSAEDVSQTFFMKLWKNRQSLAHVDRPTIFLYRSVRNVSLDVLRKQAHKENYQRFIQLSHTNTPDSPEHRIREMQLKQLITEATAHLPSMKAEVFKLRFFSSFSYSEVATTLKINESSARIYYSHSIKFIRDYIKNRIELS